MALDRAARKQIEEEIAQTLAQGDQPEEATSEAVAETPDMESHDDSGTEAESSPDQAKAPSSPGVLKSKLSQIYQLDDDTDEEELAEALIERLQRLEQAQKDAERRIAEAQARVYETQQQPVEPRAEAPAEQKKRERKLKPIVKPDDELEALVEFDPEIKRYVGKDKFGQLGQDAAKQFNDYAMARAQRAEQWISEDPAELILSEVRDEIEKIAEEKAQAYLRRIQDEQQNTQYVSQRQQSEAEFVGFMETIKPKLYHLDAKGNIKTNPITGAPATNEAGALFIQEYQELLELSPNAPPALLARKAYKAVEKMVAAPKDKKAEVAEKKKRFIDKRKHESGVTGNANVATTQDKFNGGAKVSLLAALLEDPANEDNPDLANLR